MKIKHRVGDFQVTELLADGVLQERGDHAVFRVTKRKLTSQEAAAELAELVGVDPASIGLAGLKDRQGHTVQHMSAPTRERARLDRSGLRIEHVGYTAEELTPDASRGNSFQITVRAVDEREERVFRKNVAQVREPGFVHTRAVFRLGPHDHGAVRLYEPEGWTGEVRVEDHHGRPVPYAELDVRLECRVDYAVAEDGSQTATLYTDHRGRAFLPRLSAGDVTVRATFGATREASGTFRHGVLVLRLNEAR